MNDTPTLHAFTCYSRSDRHAVTIGNPILQTRLGAELGPVSIYHDTDPLTGQKGGQWLHDRDADRAIVAVLLVADPRMVYQAGVPVEPDCFRERVHDIERALVAPAGSHRPGRLPTCSSSRCRYPM